MTIDVDAIEPGLRIPLSTRGAASTTGTASTG